MAENSKIEWTDHTWNPWEGCQKVGPGCGHCYAETRNAMVNGGAAANWGPGAPRRRTGVANWAKPRAWNAKAEVFEREHGRRQRVFCASLADWLDNAVPVQWRVDLLRVVYQTPNLDWLLLTKRIGNLMPMVEEVIRHIEAQPGWSDDAKGQADEGLRNWLGEWGLLGRAPANVWVGASVVNQDEADRDVRKLLAVPARVRFLSMEPLLGPVDLTDVPGPDSGHGHHEFSPIIKVNALKRSDPDKPHIDWVIVGGESGPGARPMHPSWVQSLRDQCQAAGVPFLFKQWGEWASAATTLSTGEMVFRQFPDFQTWVNKAPTWVHGGICLDVDGRELKNGGDMARARDAGKFPVTVMHRVGKVAAGRRLDGHEHNGRPAPAAKS